MDIKKELAQIRALLLGAYSSCDIAIKDCAVSGVQLEGILEDTERAVLHLRKLTEAVRPRQTELSHKQNAPVPFDLPVKSRSMNLAGTYYAEHFAAKLQVQNPTAPYMHTYNDSAFLITMFASGNSSEK